MHVPFWKENRKDSVKEVEVMRKIIEQFRKKNIPEIDCEEFQCRDFMFDVDRVHLKPRWMKQFWKHYIDKFLPISN